MMHIKKALYLVFGFIFLFGCGGCWNKQEPKELAIIHSLIYDINDNGQIKITAEIMNPSGIGESIGGTGGGGGEANANILITTEADSTREALSDLAKSIEKHVFGSHNKVRFFTEPFAKEHMVSILDYLIRGHLTDETPLMIVIKGEKPEEIYSASIGLSDMAGDYFEDLSERQPLYTSKSVFVTMLDFLQDYLMDGKQPVTGVAEIVACEAMQAQDAQEGGKSSNGVGAENADQDSGGIKIIQYEGLAAFKEGKLAGFMDGIEARAYNILVNEIGNAFVSVPSGNGSTVFKIGRSKADIKPSVNGEEIAFHVSVNMVLNIIEESGDKDITGEEWLSLAEDEFNQAMQQEISAAVKKAQQEFRSDIFGFGRHMHRQLPDKWKQLKENWDDRFADAAVYVTVKSMVTRTGQTKEPLKRRKEDE